MSSLARADIRCGDCRIRITGHCRIQLGKRVVISPIEQVNGPREIRGKAKRLIEQAAREPVPVERKRLILRANLPNNSHTRAVLGDLIRRKLIVEVGEKVWHATT